MPRRSRVGVALRWVPMSMSFITVAAWMLSSQWIIGYGNGTAWCAIGYGRFTLCFPPDRESGELCWWLRSTNKLDSWAGQFGVVAPWAGGRAIELPFWILAVVFMAATWKLLPRRSAVGHCVGCGYDLTGNMSGRCPECGRAARTHSAIAPGTGL